MTTKGEVFFIFLYNYYFFFVVLHITIIIVVVVDPTNNLFPCQINNNYDNQLIKIICAHLRLQGLDVCGVCGRGRGQASGGGEV